MDAVSVDRLIAPTAATARMQKSPSYTTILLVARGRAKNSHRQKKLRTDGANELSPHREKEERTYVLR